MSICHAGAGLRLCWRQWAASGVLYLSIFDTLLLLRWLGTFAILFTAFNRVVSLQQPQRTPPACHLSTSNSTMHYAPS